MERLPVEGAFAPAMQWVCGTETLAAAREAARALLRRHALAVQLWHLDDWHAMVAEGVACETQWRQGRRERIDALFARLLGPTDGPILVLTAADRAQAESLRAFAPPGRAFLSLSGSDALQPAAIAEAGWRLEQAAAFDRLRLSVI